MNDLGVHGSSRSPEHYTPQWLVDRLRNVVGDFDFDPSSCATANEVIRATSYFSLRERGEDALKLTWPRVKTMIVNPPGCRTGKTVQEFWKRTLNAHRNGTTVTWIGFNISQLATLQSKDGSPTKWPTLIPRARIAYDTLARPRSPESLWVEADLHARDAGLRGTHAKDYAATLVARWIQEPVIRIPTTAPPKNSYITVMGDDEVTERFKTEFSGLGVIVSDI